MAVLDSSRLDLADHVTKQTLGPGEDTVILSLRSGYLYTCNETTAAFLQALDGKQTLGQVIDRLHEQFDTDRETLRKDMTQLAENLLAEGLIVESP